MKLLTRVSIAPILASLVIYVAGARAAEVPTLDKTYGASPTGTPFGVTEGAADQRMKHMEVLPKSATIVAGQQQISGVETITSGGEANVKMTPALGKNDPPATVLLDFGQELAGRLQIWGTPGGRILITTGESPEECVHAEPHLDNSGPFKPQLLGQTAYCTPYSAFRYARISMRDHEPVEIRKIVCDHKYYPVQYRGSFSCSDPLLTRIWYTGAYTAHLCMQEEIWDAPKRDRGLWIGDLEVTGATINTVFADRSLMELSIAKVRQIAQGKRPATEVAENDVNTLPGYSAAWFCTLADFYRHAGDREFLAGQHELIVSLLKLQQTEFDAHDLFNNPRNAWDFCDWSPGLVTDSPLARATTDLCIIRGVHEAVYLLRELGDVKHADEYAAWADRLTAAARARLIDAKSQTYGNRLQENVMAVLSGTASEAQCKTIYSNILRAKSPAWAMFHRRPSSEDAMTPYYGYFVLKSLAQLEHTQDGLDLIRRYWGDMLKRGATTLWEMFDPAWPADMNWALNNKAPYLSLSHGWSTGPTTFLSENVLGVRSTGAGFSTAQIAPKLGDLTWAQGDVPTPSGLIHVRIDRTAAGTVAEVTVPAHVVAMIQLGDKMVKACEAGTYKISSDR